MTSISSSSQILRLAVPKFWSITAESITRCCSFALWNGQRRRARGFQEAFLSHQLRVFLSCILVQNHTVPCRVITVLKPIQTLTGNQCEDLWRKQCEENSPTPAPLRVLNQLQLIWCVWICLYLDNMIKIWANWSCPAAANDGRLWEIVVSSFYLIANATAVSFYRSVCRGLSQCCCRPAVRTLMCQTVCVCVCVTHIVTQCSPSSDNIARTVLFCFGSSVSPTVLRAC